MTCPAVHPIPLRPGDTRPSTARRGGTPFPRDLPDPAGWAAALVHETLEVLVGQRPLAALRPKLTDQVYRRIARAAPKQGVRIVHPPVIRLCAAHATQLQDGTTSTSSVMRYGDRVVSVQARLAVVDARWCCTGLTIG